MNKDAYQTLHKIQAFVRKNRGRLLRDGVDAAISDTFAAVMMSDEQQVTRRQLLHHHVVFTDSPEDRDTNAAEGDDNAATQDKSDLRDSTRKYGAPLALSMALWLYLLATSARSGQLEVQAPEGGKAASAVQLVTTALRRTGLHEAEMLSSGQLVEAIERTIALIP